ncbi:MAG TPA: hypothetical protein VFJ47_16760 [Terriglobales bacterium]|nr:hypothetical protein [Terriglobales bacterium]
MAEETPTPPPGSLPPAAPTAPVSASADQGTPFEIGEEFGTAKRNLPPARIVVIGVAIILVVAGIVSFATRAKPQGSGSIENMSVVEVPDQNMVLVAMNVSVHNTGEKALWIHTIQGDLKTETGEFTDVPVSPVDYDRYFQAFPALKEHAESALLPETKISTGGEAHGMVLVSFNVTKDAFEKRKSVGVVIQPYDQPRPIVLTK